MTIEQLSLICIGFIFNGITFALGMFVGSSMKKTVDRSSDTSTM
jgi:hypothetical protein